MTSRQRLLAAYAHAPVDCVPCSPRLNAWMTVHYGRGGAATLLEAAREFDFDPHVNVAVGDHLVALHAPAPKGPIPKVEFGFEEWPENGFRVRRRVFKTPAGTLTDVTRFPPAGDRSYGVSPNPIRTERLVKGPRDLDALAYLMPDPSRFDFAPFFEIERLMGENGLVALNIMSALCHRAGDACAMEDLMVAYHDDRPFFDRLLSMFQRGMMAEVEAALRAGVRHFFANWYYNSLSAGWSPAIWRQVFAPQLREMTDRIHAAGGTVNFYDDGRCMPILETLADCGIDVLQTLTPPPVGDVDLAEAKRRIGDRVCLMGHVDLLYVIQRGSPSDIERAVRRAIETAAPGGGFILGASDSIREGTPIENVRAYFAAARKFGRLAAGGA